MGASEVSCAVVVGLMGRWRVGELESDREAFEEHLMFCPPCLAHNDKVRIALLGLAEAGRSRPAPEVRRRVLDRVLSRTAPE
ncbi:hypothetical protein ACI2K4_13755 [Micromonospora sp. NPDC050397]|uniref:hypothetical protein n=1 Tax=Micromonospora sp. NPDC050397 TaxID=3364279 RepID=UPI00384FF56E